MDAALVALRLELGLDLRRAVGAVGPHLGSGVGLVQNVIELLAVVHAGIRLRVPADELVHAVDANVVLVAVEAVVVLLGPARILVFLGILGRLLLPAFRRLAGLDRLVLAPAVVLHGCGHDRGIDDLPAARDIALGLEMLVEQHEQLGDQSSLCQRLAEQPHSGRVRHRVLEPEVQEAHEREPVADQVFELLVSQIVQRLQHQDFEHQDRVVGLAAGGALPLLRLGTRHRLDLRTKALPRNCRLDQLKRIAFGADRLEPLVEIVEPHLPHSWSPSASSRESLNLICPRLARGIFRAAHKFNEAISFFISVESQEEVDYFWNRLIADGGEESRCGWLKDKFGLSWQVVPTALGRYLSDPDRKKADRAMQAMMKMQKIVIADLDKAFAG